LSSPSPKYRPDVDGVRAIAVMLVLNFHAFPDAMPGGLIGVDVFFVISGFLITGIIARELELGRFSMVEFYDRRIRRIFPALIVVLSARTTTRAPVCFSATTVSATLSRCTSPKRARSI
jgi:peptidoglycan/LPS O-acetylase OafA/YrhL